MSSSSLFRLPDVLLSHVCSFLTPKELLVTLARTSNSTRSLLGPSCFAAHPLELGIFELSLLSNFGPPSSLTLQPFHARVLADCRIVMRLSSDDRTMYDCSMSECLSALDHFPACRALSVHSKPSVHGWESTSLEDTDLHDLLHSAAVRQCSSLTVDGFVRNRIGEVAAQYEPYLDRRVLRAMHKITPDARSIDRSQQLNWKHVRIPALTHLRLLIAGHALYKGGAAFITRHKTLTHLDLSSHICSAAELTEGFRDKAALPLLSRFGLHDHIPRRQRKAADDFADVLLALAKTKVGGAPRRIEWLDINAAAHRDVLAAAARLPAVTRLSVSRALPGCMEQWTSVKGMSAAFPLLRDFTLRADQNWKWMEEQAGRSDATVMSDKLPFFQWLADRPMQRVDIRTGEKVIFTQPATALIGRWQQLQELSLDFSGTLSGQTGGWMDWQYPVLFSTFCNCYASLRSLQLQQIRLSCQSMSALASAAPQLRSIHAGPLEMSCHPAVACAILAGYCEHIEDVQLDDSCCHMWRDVRAVEVVEAFTVAAARRSEAYAPFSQLSHLRLMMCWCTPASVWHALLSLLGHSKRLHCVKQLSTDQPLAIAALSCLPAITSVGSDCQFPPTFGSFIQQRGRRTKQYIFVSCDELVAKPVKHVPVQPAFELIESAKRVVERLEPCVHRKPDSGPRKKQLPPIALRPRSNLFTAFRRSLVQQEKLVRWAEGNYQVESAAAKADEADERTPIDHVSAPPHALVLQHWTCVTKEDMRATERAASVDETQERAASAMAVDGDGQDERQSESTSRYKKRKLAAH